LVVSTNAVPLDKKKASEILTSDLHRLIISLDGTTKETYERIRVGAKFEKVQENVDYLLATAKAMSAQGRDIPHIWIQILKLNNNEDEWLPFVRKYTGRPRIRKIDKYTDIPGLPGGRVFCKPPERFGGQVEVEHHKEWDKANRRRFTCPKPFTRASVWWDGRVPNPACCYSIDETPTILGSLETNSLHGIWLSEPFRKVRKEFLKYRKSDGKEGILPKLCQDC